ncbi:MAG: sterol desaturase family protein [Burkholderiales bacterium]|nr:sterol desaturase family protein [Burkholderiales bacterium]
MDFIDQLLLFVALPVVVLISLVEAVALSRRQHYDWRAAGVSVLDLLARVTIQIVLPLSIATPLLQCAYRHRLTTIRFDALEPGQAILLGALVFIGQEFCYYWFHRASHRVRWFWANHAVHHSPNQLNLSAAYRIGVLSKFSGTALFFVPLVWLGFSPKLVFQLLQLNLLYQFWIHATWIPKLGWLEHVLNTPSSHRVHHAANLQYLDGNYGGVLIVFDRLFGTYIPERDDLPCRYGLVKPLTDYNLLRIEFAQWGSLLGDVFRAKSLRSAVGYVLMPPGWRPADGSEGAGETTEDMRRAARDATAHRATVSGRTHRVRHRPQDAGAVTAD